MISFKVKNPGETLTEVLVAVGIITVVLTNSLMLVSRGTSTNVSVKNKILAINIAREGIEGIRNIRDTNWLKYSGDRDGKWLCLDEIDISSNPDTINPCSNFVDTGKYIIDFNEDLGRFFAEKNLVNNRLDLANVVPDFSSYKLYKNNASAKYTHDNSAGNTETIFYRQIELTPESPPECNDGSDDYQCNNDPRLHVISRVQWQESGLVGTVVLETYLYNYLNRESY